MKIGFDAKRLYNNFTGLGNHSRTTIDILTAEFPEHEYYLYTPMIKLNNVTQPYIDKVHCHTIRPTGFLKGSTWRTFGLVQDLKRDGIDIFHGLSNEIPKGLDVAGIASVVTIHDIAFKTFPNMYHWHDRIIYNQKWSHAFKHADCIIAISECTKRDLIEFYDVAEDKIEVLYQPVNPVYYDFDNTQEAATCNHNEENPYMLYVGSINSRKNLLGIVKAMEQLPKDLQIPLVIVGNGSTYKKRVKEYIADHKMEDLFRWKEIIDNKELKELYSNAKLFIYPSFYEGFGLPVVEAQLCGCPLITSNVSSLPEAGGPFSLKIDPDNIDEISDSIIKVLTDDQLRRDMIRGEKEYAIKTFHPSVLAHKLMNIYKKL